MLQTCLAGQAFLSTAVQLEAVALQTPAVPLRSSFEATLPGITQLLALMPSRYFRNNNSFLNIY